MQRLYNLALLAALVAAPLTLAHSPAGTPKTFCETPLDRMEHDFAVGRRDLLVFAGTDGNVQDCDRNGTINDFDGHAEWGNGGGWLLASENLNTPELDGATNCFGTAAHHPLFPTVTVTDTQGAPLAFQVGIDWPMGTNGDPNPNTPTACGDGLIDPCEWNNPAEIDNQTCEANDRLIDAVGSVTLTGFLPGQDGSYIIFVDGSAGHIRT